MPMTSSGSQPILSQRALNRSLLARQLLLERVDLPAIEVIERLVGLQAQVPMDPYTALWSRVADFRPEELGDLLVDRRAVRATAMLRTTIHLFSAADALMVRPLLQAVVERSWTRSGFARNLDGIDVAEVLAMGRALLAERPHTAGELGKRLGRHWPRRDSASLGYAVRFLVPLAQPPPRGLWKRTGPALLDTLEHWLGRPLEAAPSVDGLVLRYLAAFGPATAKDIGVWSWLTGVRAVVERLRPRLRTFRDESGRELFDVPGAPLPDPDTPAPVRFLPQFDNLVLSHDDRSRVLDRTFGSGEWLRGTVLVDGFVAATWRLDTRRGEAMLGIAPFRPLARSERDDVEEEGARLAAFLEPEARARAVRIGHRV